MTETTTHKVLATIAKVPNSWLAILFLLGAAGQLPMHYAGDTLSSVVLGASLMWAVFCLIQDGYERMLGKWMNLADEQSQLLTDMLATSNKLLKQRERQSRLTDDVIAELEKLTATNTH